MKNFKNYLVERLKDYSKEEVIISSHAKIRMVQRQINKDEVISNIISTTRLDFAFKEINSFDDEKFDCYFGYSKTKCHRYILVLESKVVVVTVIKINRRWQKIIEAKLKR